MSKALDLPHFDTLPRHVAVIMDGNGRWAEKRGLPRYKGHVQGAKVFRTIGEYAVDLGINCITFYAFSTENWKRPFDEIRAIMELLDEYLEEVISRRSEMDERGIKINFFGDRSRLSPQMRMLMKKIDKISEGHDKVMLNLAINYGSRQEIVKAVQEIAEKVKSGALKPEDIDEKLISAGLYTSGMPDPDLIIRPSGEQRLSNFLMWQAAYSEFWYSDVLWPDFTTEDFNKALRDYESRHRRFGGV